MFSVLDTSGKGLLVKADIIAETFRAEVKAGLQDCTRPPKLVGILSTLSAPSRSYAQFITICNKRQFCPFKKIFLSPVTWDKKVNSKNSFWSVAGGFIVCVLFSIGKGNCLMMFKTNHDI